MKYTVFVSLTFGSFIMNMLECKFICEFEWSRPTSYVGIKYNLVVIIIWHLYQLTKQFLRMQPTCSFNMAGILSFLLAH